MLPVDKELWMRRCKASKGATGLPLEVLAKGGDDACRFLPFAFVAVKGVRYKNMMKGQGSLGLGVGGSDKSAGKASL